MKNNNRYFRFLLILVAVVGLGISTSSYAALYSRLNGQAVYDSDLNITWTADANLAATLSFGLTTVQPNGQPYPEGALGSMFGTFTDNWIGALNAYQGTGYLGFNDWRLTTDHCTDTAGYYCTDSEFGYLFYFELGGSAYNPISASNSPNLALFTNIVESNWYWTGSLSSGHTRVFNFGDGAHSQSFDTLAKYQVWAVRDGDVATVPIPAAFWLFGPGVIGLLGFRRKRT